MAGRRDRTPMDEAGGRTDPGGAEPDAIRRTLLRGAAAAGLAGATGIGLTGCGGDGTDRTVASTQPDPVPAGDAGTRNSGTGGSGTAGTGPGGAPSKSELYRRTPERRSPGTPPEPAEQRGAPQRAGTGNPPARKGEDRTGAAKAAEAPPPARERPGTEPVAAKRSDELKAAQREDRPQDGERTRNRRPDGPATADPASTKKPAASSSPTPRAPGELAKTSEIPVGGGKVFPAEKVVVTQPTSGTFKGFSAICTHEQCTVGDVSGGTINCPCHGSTFAVADGSVTAGPARTPLPAEKITVTGDSVRRG